MFRSMRLGYGAGPFFAGTLFGMGLALAVPLFPLPSFWWKALLALLLVALSAGAIWLWGKGHGAGVQPEDQKAVGERIAASLDSLVAAMRESAAPRESLRDLTAAISALPDKLARVLGSSSSPPGDRKGEPPRRVVSEAPLKSMKEEPRREGRPAPSGGDITASLVRAWTRYFDEGDGRFTTAGLQWVLEQEGLTKARAIPGDRCGAGDDVLAVTFDDSNEVFLLPNFTTSVHALSNRFEVGKGMARDANVRRLVRPAVARRSGSGLEVVAKGAVE